MLAHQRLTAPGADPTRQIAVLHGILGQGQNWRTFAKALVQARPDWAALLIDLRAHGGSKDLPPPDSLTQAAADVRALTDAESLPVRGLLGHSFGGKVGVAYAATGPADLGSLIVVDSMPGRSPERRESSDTMAVVATLETLPATFASRPAFVAHMTEQGHDETVGRWLAMNLERDDADRFRFTLDPARIRRLLDGYFDLDLWPVLVEAPFDTDLVIGGKSPVYAPDDVATAEQLAARSGGRVRTTTLDTAHWVHVEDPEGLLAIILGALDRVAA